MNRRVHNDVPPDWMRPGATVWYYPHARSETRYAGVVESEPWDLGGTWVVRLCEMDHAYRDGARTTVPAAACWAVERREEASDLVQHNNTPPAWMVPGARVWFYASGLRFAKHAGIVATKPWQAGPAKLWVVRLEAMARSYGATTVPEAPCWAVEERSVGP